MPRFDWGELGAAGVLLPNLADAEKNRYGAKFALIEFPTPDQTSEWIAAGQNFFVITRYNQSSFYARAVLDLAATLQTARALARLETSGRK